MHTFHVDGGGREVARVLSMEGEGCEHGEEVRVASTGKASVMNLMDGLVGEGALK